MLNMISVTGKGYMVTTVTCNQLLEKWGRKNGLFSIFS